MIPTATAGSCGEMNGFFYFDWLGNELVAAAGLQSLISLNLDLKIKKRWLQ